MLVNLSLMLEIFAATNSDYYYYFLFKSESRLLFFHMIYIFLPFSYLIPPDYYCYFGFVGFFKPLKTAVYIKDIRTTSWLSSFLSRGDVRVPVLGRPSSGVVSFCPASCVLAEVNEIWWQTTTDAQQIEKPTLIGSVLRDLDPLGMMPFSFIIHPMSHYGMHVPVSPVRSTISLRQFDWVVNLSVRGGRDRPILLITSGRRHFIETPLLA